MSGGERSWRGSSILTRIFLKIFPGNRNYKKVPPVPNTTMKPSFKYSFIAILAFVVLLLPTASFSETKKIAVLPWKINSAQKLDYLGSAMVDMLVSRVG